MVLFTILALILLVILGIILFVVGAGSIAFILVFGDVILCGIIIVAIFKRIFKNRKRS